MTHIVFLLALFCSNPDLNKKYPFRIFTFSILLLFLALRYGYGNDYFGYYAIHTLINSGSTAWGSSNILFRLMNLSTSNYDLFIAIISCIYIIGISFLIEKNMKKNLYWISICVLLINPYLFLIHLSGLRQTLAIVFLIFAVHFGTKRKPIIYVLFIFIAMGFHSSAVILFPLYFILNDKKFRKKEMFLSFIIIVLLLFSPLFDLMANEFFEYLPQYRHYYEMGIQNSIRSTVISSCFYLFIVLNINKLDGKELIYGKLSLIGTMISILAIKVSMISRIGMYFDIFLVLTIPHILDKYTSKSKKYIFLMIIISLYLLRYVSFFTTPLWESYFKYRTILTN